MVHLQKMALKSLFLFNVFQEVTQVKKGGNSKSALHSLVIILLVYLTYMSRDRIGMIFRYISANGLEEAFQLFQMRPERFAALLYPLLLILCGILVLIRSAWRREARQASAAVHTHDRTDRISYNVNETEFEHYKKQLDGFLKAGIIEKEEYHTLLNRYSRK